MDRPDKAGVTIGKIAPDSYFKSLYTSPLSNYKLGYRCPMHTFPPP